METNFSMIKELDKKYDSMNHIFGIVTMKEIYLINETLHLDEMDILQLRNLRDFVVANYGYEADEALRLDNFESADDLRKIFDKISAITSVIDQKIINLGGEV